MFQISGAGDCLAAGLPLALPRPTAAQREGLAGGGRALPADVGTTAKIVLRDKSP